jgi:type IV pilus assembly protein PilC
LQSGLPVFQTLGITAAQTENPALKRALTEVIERVESGQTLAGAFRLSPGVFPEMFTSMVEAGEASGALDLVLERLAVHFEKEHEIREQIRVALTYPAVVLIIAALAVGIIMTFVIPNFMRIMNDMNVAVPLFTRAVFGASESFRHYGHLAAFALVLGAAGVRYFLRETVAGKEALDRLVLRLPVIGRLARKVIVARFARTLGTMVRSGVPILSALEVIKRITGNVVFARAIEDTINSVAEGRSMAEALDKSVFPPMVTRIVAVGEETGSLEEMLEKVAAFFDRDVETAIKRLAATVEPVLTVVIGGLVGAIIFSILVPLFSIYGSFE